MMRNVRTKTLTPAGKAVVILLSTGLVGGSIFGLYKGGVIRQTSVEESNKAQLGSNTQKSQTATVSVEGKEDNVINLSVDEWIGFKSIIDANGGLTTQKGSIYDELGLEVNVNIINDGAESSSALVKGDLDAAGYTVNRYAFLYDKFETNQVDVVMPYITNYSNGGDGVIAREGVNSVNDLVGKKIGVARFSEAQTLIAWLVGKSDLSHEEQQEILDNLILFDTADDAANAFFAGQLDVAATWQPYLSQAQETTGCKLLFSTRSATDLVLDGVVFRKDFMDANPETVQKFIEGTLKASELYTTSFTPIKDSMALFATETDESILGMTGDAALTTHADNMDLLTNGAVSMFEDMSNVWIALGEKAYPEKAEEAFDITAMEAIASCFEEEEALVSKVPAFTEEQRREAKATLNTEALLQKSTTINFKANSAIFVDQAEAEASLREFVKIADALNGAIIQIEGNIADTGEGDTEAGRLLSAQRAKAVAQYLQSQGIDNSRFVIVGNGITNPISDNKTEEGMAQNRRTDVYFKIIE